jgi:peptidoglycan hydrolase CwlO-like protein
MTTEKIIADSKAELQNIQDQIDKINEKLKDLNTLHKKQIQINQNMINFLNCWL